MNVNIPSVSATGNQIMAINDLNNDKLDDLIMANAEGTVLTVYYFVATTLSYGITAEIQLPENIYVRNVFVTKDNNLL